MAPLSVQGAGPILVDTDGSGEAVVWQDGVIRFNLESEAGGGLGTLSNAEATALVRELFEDWKDLTIGGVDTVSLTLSEGSALGSVGLSNMDDHFTYCPAGESCPTESSPFVIGSARSGESPILFDQNGTMTDAVQGTGASLSILGFAGPRVVERVGGVLYITEGQSILNGLFIDGVSSSSNPEVTVDEFKGAIFHEIGHFIGLDHTQVGINSVVKYLRGDTSEKAAIPTMLPLFVDGEEQLTPHFDDQVAISYLYPSASYDASFCRIEGRVLASDGATELQGVNVIVSNGSDRLVEATSFVSGSLYTGVYANCGAPFGEFVLGGLTPGRSYVLEIEEVSQAFTGGSSLEPCDPPQEGFDAAVVPGSFSCTSGGEVITAGTEATTDLVTTKSSTSSTDDGDDTGNTTTQSQGGCSLVP